MKTILGQVNGFKLMQDYRERLWSESKYGKQVQIA